MLARLAFALALCATVAWSQPIYEVLSFGDLDGWAEDDHSAALKTYRDTCDKLADQDWSALCAVAHEVEDGRAFFEMFFLPVVISDGEAALFTGYYEPELRGARRRGGRYIYPVYRLPSDARRFSRREIYGGALRGRGLEIAYVDDPVDLFYTQIQGSGRIRLNDGTVLRLGYAGANGRPYSSLGLRIVARGHMNEHQASANNIRAWVAKNLSLGLQLMSETESYVFFVEREIEESTGPIGALSRSITEGRSIAVDRNYIPLGAPVWIEVDGSERLRRLVVAQDVGSAIKGAQRADIFFGFGDEAGRRAQRMKASGRMVTLMPIQRAFDLIPEVIK